MIHHKIHASWVGSETGSFVGSYVGVDILEMSTDGMFDVVESRIRFLIVVNFLLIYTVIVDGTDCVN